MIHLNSKKVLIVDLDNCLCDDRKRAHMIDWNKINMDDRYEAYHAGCGEDAASAALLEAILQAQQCEDHRIIFITARPWKFRAATESWLHKFNVLKYHLYMRNDGDHRPSPVYKREVLRRAKEFFGFSYDDCIAFDDHVGVLAAYFSEGLRSVVHMKCHDTKMHTEDTNLYRPLDADPTKSPLQEKLDDIFDQTVGGEPQAGDRVLLTPRLNAGELLAQAAATYRERNAIYGDNYRRFGGVMHLLFPKGIDPKTPEDWNRLGIFVQCVSKISRYAENLDAGGHYDSAHDLSVYAAMLQELTDK